MNNAARMTLRLPRQSHISHHLRDLHWLPVRHRINYKLACICYHCINSADSPLYLKQLIPKKTRSKYNTRSISDTSALQDPPADSKKTLGDRSFSRAGPVVWNDLPQDVRLAQSTSSFKSSLKSHYFRDAYS